jgi:hypothetical protein
MDLTPHQIAILQRLQTRGFQIVAFERFANHVGVRKASCAALLAPLPSGGFDIFTTPAYLVEGNLSVRVSSAGRDWFVWKSHRLEATAERAAEVQAFADELSELLLPTA